MLWAYIYLSCCLIMLGLLVSYSEEVFLEIALSGPLKPFLAKFKDEKTAYHVIFVLAIILSPLFLISILLDFKK